MNKELNTAKWQRNQKINHARGQQIQWVQRSNTHKMRGLFPKRRKSCNSSMRVHRGENNEVAEKKYATSYGIGGPSKEQVYKKYLENKPLFKNLKELKKNWLEKKEQIEWQTQLEAPDEIVDVHLVTNHYHYLKKDDLCQCFSKPAKCAFMREQNGECKLDSGILLDKGSKIMINDYYIFEN